MAILIQGLDMPESGGIELEITSSGYVLNLAGEVIRSAEAQAISLPYTTEEFLDFLERREDDYQNMKENIRIARTMWCDLKVSVEKLGGFLV